MLRTICLGLLLLLLAGLGSLPVAQAAGVPPAALWLAQATSPAPTSLTPAASPTADQAAQRGKPRNPYDMEALKNFDAGSHRRQ
jgi:hypothetical protein